MKYKGYHALLEIGEADELICGWVSGMDKTSFMFYGKTFPEARANFHMVVDGYLSNCKNRGLKPEKQYTGDFSVRIPPELHEFLAEVAHKRKASINETVVESLRQFLAKYREVIPVDPDAPAPKKPRKATGSKANKRKATDTATVEPVPVESGLKSN